METKQQVFKKMQHWQFSPGCRYFGSCNCGCGRQFMSDRDTVYVATSEGQEFKFATEECVAKGLACPKRTFGHVYAPLDSVCIHCGAKLPKRAGTYWG